LTGILPASSFLLYSRLLHRSWGYSSAGRAAALQAVGQGFESPYLHSGIVRDGPLEKRAFENADAFSNAFLMKMHLRTGLPDRSKCKAKNKSNQLLFVPMVL
jgi:hypothetical protein